MSTEELLNQFIKNESKKDDRINEIFKVINLDPVTSVNRQENE